MAVALGPRVHFGAKGVARTACSAVPASSAVPLTHACPCQARMAVEGAEDDADNHKWLEQSREAYIKGARCISSPCLILRGRESDLVSLDGVKDFLAAVPHAEFVDIADAHHMVAGDSNSVFTAEVLAFLSKLFPSPAGSVSERICVAGM